MNERASSAPIAVLICHAPVDVAPWQQNLLMPVGSTVEQALAASDFGTCFPGRDPWQDGVGIHGKMVGPAQILLEHDRIEIYRPLVFDPMTSRRRRAAHKQRHQTDKKT